MMDIFLNESLLHSIWCVVPVYNNGATVRDVALGCREQLDHVLVVDDGSTDVDVAALFSETDIEVLTHSENQGKGAALKSALEFVHERKGQWMLCIDADGQHHPEDIPRFFQTLEEFPNSIVIGARDFDTPNVPKSSRFGRKFSNFWIQLECGARVSDSQSGFRAYPVALIRQMSFRGHQYDFEVEVLSKAVWYGLSLEEVPIRVFYAPGEERISHFDKRRDNCMLTHRHAMLMSRRLLPWPHPKLVPLSEADWRTMVRHPKRFFLFLLRERATPRELAIAAGVGLFLATLPLIFMHTVVILYVSSKMRLNRLLALNVQHLCAPPWIPLACIEVGFFLRNGTWIDFEALKTMIPNLHQYVLNWLLGSLVLAPVLGILGGLSVYALAGRLQKTEASV